MSDDGIGGGWLTFGFHIFHRWSKWEDGESGTIRDSATKGVIGRFVFQSRRCSVCGKLHNRVAEARQ